MFISVIQYKLHLEIAGKINGKITSSGGSSLLGGIIKDLMKSSKIRISKSERVSSDDCRDRNIPMLQIDRNISN